MTIRAISYGGGVQSTSLLVLAATGQIDYPLFLMANVGDDSEHPDTLAYVRDVAVPYAADHGIELVLLDRLKNGETFTLYERLTTETGASIGIPAFIGDAPGSRSCTRDFKIRVIARELRRRGATKADPATVGIGISLDEIGRIGADPRVVPNEHLVYPLVGVGDETGLKLRRNDCARIIAEAGLPVPPKSSCWFCPYHKASAWSDLAREHPDLFERAARLEASLQARRVGRTPVFLTRGKIPLREAIDTGQDLLPLEDDDGGDWSCGSGWCAT